MTAILEIDSENPDIVGCWNEADVEAEMPDLGIKIDSDTDWIDFVISRNFDNYVFPRPVCDAIKLFKDDVFNADFYLGGNLVRIRYDGRK